MEWRSFGHNDDIVDAGLYCLSGRYRLSHTIWYTATISDAYYIFGNATDTIRAWYAYGRLGYIAVLTGLFSLSATDTLNYINWYDATKDAIHMTYTGVQSSAPLYGYYNIFHDWGSTYGGIAHLYFLWGDTRNNYIATRSSTTLVMQFI